MRPSRRRGPQAGFTLIELMVSLVLFSFVIAGILGVAVMLARGFREQKGVIGAEGTARAAMDYIGEAVRGASPAVTTGDVQALYMANCTGTPGNSFVLTNNTNAPDELTVVFASGSVATSLDNAFSGGTTMVVNDASEIGGGDMVLVSDFGRGHIAKVASKSGNTLTLTTQSCTSPTWPSSGGYAEGAIVVRALRARFFVAPLDNVPTLWMDPDAEGPALEEPLAEGVEDFQVALAIDVDGNGVITQNGAAAGDDEWYFNVAGETLPAAPYTIRAIRINVVVRSLNLAAGIAAFYRPAAGDRTAATTPDNYRRRILSSTVEIRNLVGSK